jgi:hypothetical protein
VAAFTPALGLAQVPPPPGAAGPVPPPPPPAAPMPATGAASGDILQGVNPDVQLEANASAATDSKATSAQSADKAEDVPSERGESDASDDVGDSEQETDAEGNTAVTGNSGKLKEEQAIRAKLLHNAPSLRGSTGLFRMHAASSGPVGTFRFGLLTSYMSSTGFLCPQCEAVDGGDPAREDDVSRVGGHVQIGATVLPFLEAYFGVHSTATHNSRGKPVLLQTLADTTWGLKAFMPYHTDQVYTAGGALELWMLNGPGGVGIDSASAAVRLLGTADYSNRTRASDRIPLRAHFNLSYVFDNSGGLVEELASNVLV